MGMPALIKRNPKRDGIALFKVGDEVRFLCAVDYVQGTIVEDRGNLGVGGRVMYRVRVPSDPYLTNADHWDIELPEDELIAVE